MIARSRAQSPNAGSARTRGLVGSDNPRRPSYVARRCQIRPPAPEGPADHSRLQRGALDRRRDRSRARAQATISTSWWSTTARATRPPTLAASTARSWCRIPSTSATARRSRPATSSRRATATTTWCRWMPTASTIPPTSRACSSRCASGEADVVIGSRFVESSGYEMGSTRTVGRVFFQRLLVLLRRAAHRRSDLRAAGAGATGVPLLLLRLLPVRLPRHRRALAAAPPGLPHPRGPGEDGAEPAGAADRCTPGCAPSTTPTRCCSRRFAAGSRRAPSSLHRLSAPRAARPRRGTEMIECTSSMSTRSAGSRSTQPETTTTRVLAAHALRGLPDRGARAGAPRSAPRGVHADLDRGRASARWCVSDLVRRRALSDAARRRLDAELDAVLLRAGLPAGRVPQLRGAALRAELAGEAARAGGRAAARAARRDGRGGSRSGRAASGRHDSPSRDERAAGVLGDRAESTGSAITPSSSSSRASASRTSTVAARSRDVDSVLDVGAGSGFSSALLSGADPRGRVRLCRPAC